MGGGTFYRILIVSLNALSGIGGVQTYRKWQEMGRQVRS